MEWDGARMETKLFWWALDSSDFCWVTTKLGEVTGCFKCLARSSSSLRVGGVCGGYFVVCSLNDNGTEMTRNGTRLTVSVT